MPPIKTTSLPTGATIDWGESVNRASASPPKPVESNRPKNGAGGGAALAERLDVPLIGQVPLVPALREGADYGRPVAADPATEVGAVFAEMARVLDVEMKPTKRRHRELKIL